MMLCLEKWSSCIGRGHGVREPGPQIFASWLHLQWGSFIDIFFSVKDPGRSYRSFVLILKDFVWFNYAQGRGFPWRSICYGTRKRNPARNDPQHTEQPGHEAHQWRWEAALPSPFDCPKNRRARGAAPVLKAPCWSWLRIQKGRASLWGPLFLFVNGP